MMWVLLGLAIVVVGVVGFAALLASRAKQAYDSSNEVVPGGKVRVSFDEEKLHFFEATQNGRNLYYG